nr:ABC transporter ATP-binding protein [Ramlibacter aurantiacus]
MAVEVRGLRKHYVGKGADRRRSEVVAIDGVDLQVRAGELVVLLGPSGCGKTTLLRCIAGLERPQHGEVRVHGRIVFSAEAGVFVPPEHRHIGMMFQSYALWPHMTVQDNVAYPLAGHAPRAQREQQVDGMLERLGIAGLGHRYPGELSGGQQQRVALARALIASQSLVLFDEPLSNVDAKVRKRLRAELREVKRRNGFAGVYVTHDQEEAMELADTLVVMESGRIRQVGSPRAVYERPASIYVADFVGDINRWPARLVEPGRARCELGTLQLSDRPAQARDGDDGWVGIRPEHVNLAPASAGTLINRVPAIVQDIVHLGARIECRMSAGGMPLTAHVADAQAHHLSVGQAVDALLPPEMLRWLPR